MGKDNKKYWLDKSTLAGVVKTGEEIPDGLLKEERIKELEELGMIGELPKVAEKNNISVDEAKKLNSQIEALKSENEKLKAENEELKKNKSGEDDDKNPDEKKGFFNKGGGQ